MTTYQVTVAPAVVYRVRPSEGHGEWADAYVREWPKGGSLSIQSSYGDFAHTWSNIGECRFRDFLRGLDFDYFMKKASEKAYLEFDIGLTLRAIRQEILAMRRAGDLTREKARSAWDEIAIEMPHWGEGEFSHRFYESRTIGLVYQHDVMAVPTRSRVNASCQRFWQDLWPVLCDAWQVPADELAA